MEPNTEAEQKERPRKFTKGYTFKILLLIAMLLILLIPLAMIRGLVNDRHRTAQIAEAGIMEAWGSELVAVGPMLLVPIVSTTGTATPFFMTIMPQRLDIAADLSTEVRRRGIFSVPLFSGEISFSGTFDTALAADSLAPADRLLFDQAELVIALSDQKGIRRIERARWDNGDGEDGRELFFRPGNRGLDIVRGGAFFGGPSTVAGIFAAVQGFEGGEAAFDVSISMQGGRMLRFLPSGQQTRASISSDWASPSFQGSILPGDSRIDERGFTATWDISYLSRDIPLFWETAGQTRHNNFGGSLFGVDFFRAIDTYSLNTRATRYAVLFLIVPFLTMFLLEVHTKKPIHPVQYLLSGIANVVFYLLLLSFSEQMPFHFAYTIAALAVATLLTLYSRSLLPTWGKSGYMAAAVSVSYILLYAVLNAESFALLIGSVFTFALVALVMFLTRNMNWYGSEE